MRGNALIDDLPPPRDQMAAIGRAVAEQERLPQIVEVEIIVAVDRDDPLDQRIEAAQGPEPLLERGAHPVEPAHYPRRDGRGTVMPERMRVVWQKRQQSARLCQIIMGVDKTGGVV